MKIRAIICDVYQTILAISPPPVDASEQWSRLCERTLGAPPRLTLEQFSTQTLAIVAREHTAARSFGISFPEIQWPQAVGEVLPELAKLSEEEGADFIWQQMQLLRAIHLLPSAGEGLRALEAKGLVLGIASNAQAYTLQELDLALKPAGLSRKIFVPALSFFSFEHGFSKPDPHVFRLLTARLHLRGIAPRETLMFGNRLDNDIGPAHAQGWQTWHFTEGASVESGHEGNWSQLIAWLSGRG